MSWRPIDFQGIVNLDHKIVEQLEQFLQQKEDRLAHQILNAIPSFESLMPASGMAIKLSDAVEGFTKKVRLFMSKGNVKDRYAIADGDKVVKDINSALWEFTEILEECVVELFQRVHQVPIDRWHISIAHVVHVIKDILIHYIEDLMWTMRRVEKPLKEYCQKMDPKAKNWFYRLFAWKYCLDRNLSLNLQKTEKFLKRQYGAFQQRYNEYMGLSVQVEDDLQKMKSYPILALLDMLDQNLYVDVFRLLKTLELNRQSKGDVAIDTARALKRLASIDHVLHVLRTYFQEIKDAFFNSSLEWKSLDHEGENFKEALQKLQSKLQVYQQELQELMHTMSRYRLFILRNNPNPYLRSRWGFTEWIVGPEPARAKKLTNMIYAVEELNGYFTQFRESLVHDPLTQQQIEQHAHQEIEMLLHEMGQPLISHAMMRNRVDRLLAQLKACDEVSSSRMATIFYVENVLAKAMREDWKYHVLHEFPLFHQIYRIHQGLFEYFEDPAHAFRLERFHLLFDQIGEWVEKEDVYSHVHEMELDMNDMKTYLQDFLATVQRALKDKSHDPFLDDTIHKLAHQLLEYRYLFGQFFLSIMSKSQDSILLRNQFLFVDQYFESVESLLNELIHK